LLRPAVLSDIRCDNADELMPPNPLNQLIQEDQFVGWVCQLDYEKAVVLTNDLWKIRASGIPLNCFLLATAIDPKNPAETKEAAGNYFAPRDRRGGVAGG
jgi:hypothetical protein